MQRLLDSIADASERPDQLEVVFRVDADDPSSHALWHPRLATVLVAGPPGEPMGRMFRACYEASRGRLLMLMNDDAVVRTRRWDTFVLGAFDRFPDGIALVWGNDLDQGRRVPTFPILPRIVAELLGGVCPEEYRHFHIESHLHDVFRRLAAAGYERRVYLEDVVFEHEHYLLGKAARDATYRRYQYLGVDEQVYFELAAYRRRCADVLRAHIDCVAAAGGGVGASGTGRAESGADLRFQCRDRPRTVVVVVVGGWAETPRPAPPACLWDAMPGTVIKIASVPGGADFARMANVVLARAEGELIAFVPQGALPGPGWPGAAQHLLDSEEAVAACGVRVIDPWKRVLLHAGIAFGQAGDGLTCVPLYQGLPADHPAATRPRRLQAVSFAGLVARRAALLGAGGFDEALPSEALAVVDLCLRLTQRGWAIRYVPDAVLYWDRPLGADLFTTQGTRPPAWRGRARSDLEEILRQDALPLASRHGDFADRSGS